MCIVRGWPASLELGLNSIFNRQKQIRRGLLDPSWDDIYSLRPLLTFLGKRKQAQQALMRLRLGMINWNDQLLINLGRSECDSIIN